MLELASCGLPASAANAANTGVCAFVLVAQVTGNAPYGLPSHPGGSGAQRWCVHVGRVRLSFAWLARRLELRASRTSYSTARIIYMRRPKRQALYCRRYCSYPISDELPRDTPSCLVDCILHLPVSQIVCLGSLGWLGILLQQPCDSCCCAESPRSPRGLERERES